MDDDVSRPEGRSLTRIGRGIGEAEIEVSGLPKRLIGDAVTYDASGRAPVTTEAESFEPSISHHGEYVIAAALSDVA